MFSMIDEEKPGSAAASPPREEATVPPTDEQAAIRSVDQLRALADPIRQAILEVLMPGGPELPIMSVKELAAALSEPQTKLYRHVRQLESAGLIRVAATRLVSGIAEQRYQACQRNLELAPGLLRQHIDEAEAVVRALFEGFRTGFLAEFRQSRASAEPADDDNPLARTTMLMSAYGRLGPAKLAAMRAALEDALAYFGDEDSADPDAVHVNLIAGYYFQREDDQE